MKRRINILEFMFIQCLLLGLVLQQSCAQHNFNAYDDYDDERNYNNHHPLDNQHQYGGAPLQPHYEPQDPYASSRGEMPHQPYMHAAPTRPEYQDPRVTYQPYQEEHTPAPPQDPRVYQNYPQESNREDRRSYQPYPEEPSQDPRVYQPHPEQPPPPPQDPNVILVPRLGLVRGQHNFKVIKGRAISAYLGLKYGSVRPGLGRFQKASKPELNTNSIIEATQEPSNCPQFPDLVSVTEKERRGENVDDCLTLNIFTPAKSGSYPVLVFIHGEMLFDGSAEEGQPDYFLEHDVVLVSINYRLAPFGYLSTLTAEMPGNVALADIQMALEWIQQNIRAFNGNADQVTLLGQAGGASLIHALSLSGKAEGLFHKLILQSGTALNPYFVDEQPLTTLRNFAYNARCPPSRTVDGLVSCFERMSTSELLNNFERYFKINEPKGLMFNNAFKLIVGDNLGYLPQHPASMLANNTKPMIVGVTKDAGAFIMSRFYDELVQLRSRNISDYINIVLKHTAQQRHYQLWNHWALKHIFTQEDARNPSVNGLVQKLLELVNLILYRGPIIDSIRFTSKNHSTYMYCFDYRGEYHRFGHLRNPLPFEIDATLSDDNIYLFPYPTEVSHLNYKDKSIVDSIVSLWVNFAQNNVSDSNTGSWPKVSTEYGPFLRFTNAKDDMLELDYHFGEGIPVPNLFPEYFNTTFTTKTTTTTTTTTTTQRPYPNYSQYSNYRQPQRSSYPNYRSHETVLNDFHDEAAQPSARNYAMNPRYSNYQNMRH